MKPPLLLRAVAVTMFVFPASMVIAPLGALGYVSMLLALLLTVLWFGSSILGLHDPIASRHPARVAMAILVLVSCLSYGAFVLGLTIPVTGVAQLSADRWLLLICASVGLVLVTSETVRSLDDAMVLVRAMLAGGAFCAVVAIIQFTVRLNPMTWVQTVMVGFVDNGGTTSFQDRGLLVRVAGSTAHPIELAVVMAMLLPLSVWRALYDKEGRKWIHWTITVLLLIGNSTTVSRTGVMTLAVAALVFIPFLPRLARRWALVASPAAIAVLFLTTPGLIATLAGSFTAGDADPSITNRLDNYPRVAQMVAERPFLGTGPGTYLPDSAIYILDNEYLRSAVEMGLIGAAAIAIYLIAPALFGIIAAQYARNEKLRSFAAAAAAGCTVAAVSSGTFDSLSFPVVSLLLPIMVGLVGSAWILVKHEGLTPAFSGHVRPERLHPPIPLLAATTRGSLKG
ncbi:MAG: polymerase [Subtercola sp.]|nr:polymerase [Subtercola sp.]